MIPDVVVDIGNTRMKWGRCTTRSVADFAVLDSDDTPTWDEQYRRWNIGADSCWAISDVAPARYDTFNAWLQRFGCRKMRISEPSQLSLKTNVDHPSRVGIDRLLDAVAVNSRRTGKRPAIVIDAGSAVTVDLLDEDGVFQGGAILPGFRLLAKSLHDYTALLPIVSMPESLPLYPSNSTEDAVRTGVFWMVVGGVRTFIDKTHQEYDNPPAIFLAGGDGPLLKRVLPDSTVHWPSMTLEGIRLTAMTLSQEEIAE